MTLRKFEDVRPDLEERADEFASYNEMARILGLTTRTLRRWVALKRIPFKRLGARTIRFSKPEVEAWLRKRSVMR